MSNSNLSLPTKLAAIFGTGTEIKVHVLEDSRATFYDNVSQNLWETQLTKDSPFRGPGRYKLSIKAGEFDFTEEDSGQNKVSSMKAAQFVEVVDEAVGNPGSGETLSVIFRQLLKDNNVTEGMVSDRLDALLDKFPSPSVGREAMKNHVTAELAANMMTWEAFVIGMKIVGAETITLAVR